MNIGENITLDGIKYVVVRVEHYLHNGQRRQQIAIRRQKGKKIYVVYLYENGTYSHVIGI